MNPALIAVGRNIAGVIGSAILLAFSTFLAKVVEPVIAWISFSTMKLLIKITKSKALREIYKDMRKAYKDSSYNPYASTTYNTEEQYGPYDDQDVRR